MPRERLAVGVQRNEIRAGRHQQRQWEYKHMGQQSWELAKCLTVAAEVVLPLLPQSQVQNIIIVVEK